MKKRYIFYIILALGLSWLVYYRISANKKIENSGGSAGGGGKGKGKGAAGPAMTVLGTVVKHETFDNDLEITGSIDANESVMLHSEVSGLVTSINFKEGSYVSKGTVLVRINDRDIQAQLRQAVTRQNLSATNYSRAKQLLQKGAISQEEYDSALADLNTLKAQTQLTETQLAKTKVVAPFSGRIGLRAISVGEYLTPATAIANLLSTNPVKITFSVPEKYVDQIRDNMNVSFTTSSSAKTYSAKVFAIEPGIDAQTRTLQIKALAPNPQNELRPGSFVKIKLALTQVNNAILIPNEAVIPVLKGKIVYIVKNGKAQQVPVEASTRTADKILISSGLQVGDTVLTSGAMALKPDMPVKVSFSKN